MNIFNRPEFYIVVNSTLQQAVYPNNKPYNFKVILTEPLKLEGDWSVALVDIVWHNKFQSSDTEILRMFIESNIVVPTQVTSQKRQVLATVPILTTRNARMFYEPRLKHYVRLGNVDNLQELEFYIKYETGSFITSFERDVSITLHFQKLL